MRLASNSQTHTNRQEDTTGKQKHMRKQTKTQKEN